MGIRIVELYGGIAASSNPTGKRTILSRNALILRNFLLRCVIAGSWIFKARYKCISRRHFMLKTFEISQPSCIFCFTFYFFFRSAPRRIKDRMNWRAYPHVVSRVETCHLFSFFPLSHWLLLSYSTRNLCADI